MSRVIKVLRKVNFNTLYFNLKYLPLKDAIKLPVFVSKKVFLLETKGSIEINAPIKTGMIRIGYGKIGIFDMERSRSVWQVSGKVTFNGKADIGHGTKISVGGDAHLKLGKNFSVSAESQIVTQKSIQFGDDVLISWDCLIMDTDFHKIYDQRGNLKNSPEPVIVGQKVWIGCRNVILKGTRISDGSIIGANSFLSRDISDQSGIFAGNPVRFVKGDVSWEN